MPGRRSGRGRGRSRAHGPSGGVAAAALLVSGRKGGFDIRDARLHMAADAAVPAGVVPAGPAILATGRSWLDPLAGLAAVAAVTRSTWGRRGDSFALSLPAAPAWFRMDGVRGLIGGLAGTASGRDLRVRPTGAAEPAKHGRSVMPGGRPRDILLAQAATAESKGRFGIGRATPTQAESGEDAVRALAPDHGIL